MSFYTIIFEYRNGTYIEQLEAINENEALKNWAINLNPNTIQYLGEKLKEKLVREVEYDLLNESPTPLLGCKSVWCAGCYIGGLVNIVKTER